VAAGLAAAAMEVAVDVLTQQPSPQPVSATRSAMRGLDREHAFRPLRVEGRLPADLRGTLYRNGPAVFDSGRDPHWFDGNGAVVALRLDGEGAAGAVRVVHSPSADRDAGRRDTRYGAFRQRMSVPERARALFGENPVRNVANINVLPWQGRLFALYETTPPVEIDPQTLASLGETDLGGVIRGGWNAHPHRVPERATTYQMGLRVGPRPALDIYALPDRGAPSLLSSLPLPGVSEVHDLFVTRNHIVLVLPPLWGSPMAMLWRGSFVESLEWDAAGATQVVVVPIDEPERIIRIETEPFFFWHGVNAFEAEDGTRIVLDLVRYPDFAGVLEWLDRVPSGLDGAAHPGRLWRGEIDLAARSAHWRQLWDRSCEFPRIHPELQGRRHRFAWMAAHSSEDAARTWWDRLVRFDFETGEVIEIDAGPDRAVGEPIPVPKGSGEDAVWVLAMVTDFAAGATHLGIWDGTAPTDPVARLWFDQQLPPSLHGAWVQDPVHLTTDQGRPPLV